jgi:hypothetical protein
VLPQALGYSPLESLGNSDVVMPISEASSITSKEIDEVFQSIERDLPFTYGKLCGSHLNFVDHQNDPVHRWFYYKESYSPDFVRETIHKYPPPSRYPYILDPFCGAGTSLLAAQSLDYPSIGIEINPFAHFLASVKIHRQLIYVNELESALVRVLKNENSCPINIPTLTTFHQKHYFPDNSIYEIFRLRETISRIRTEPHVREALLLALVSSTEEASRLRRDGRMLRYVPKRQPKHPKDAFRERVTMMIEDLRLEKYDQPELDTIVFKGDARKIDKLLQANGISRKFGLIVYSPPYPNNFDYSEVYKLQLWLSGFISSYDEWLALRRKTLRSHPSCSFFEENHLNRKHSESKVVHLINLLINCKDISGSAQYSAPNVISGYFNDMFLTLQQQVKRLAPGGHIVCVVGNAQHGNLHVPADTLIAELGKLLGLEVVEISVGKLKMSRTQQVRELRESAVILKKPRYV